MLTYLESQGIWCCGTVQGRRLPSLKFKPDSDLCEERRGSKDIWKAEIDGITVAAIKWQHIRSVCLVSTFTAHLPEGVCSRYDKKQKAIIEISRPNIVAVYNKNMDGVDLQDQVILLYRMSYRSKKYYHRIIFHLFDMAVVSTRCCKIKNFQIKTNGIERI